MSTEIASAMAAAPINAPGRTNDAAVAARTAQDFEAVFISQMLGKMFEGVSTDGPFGGGQGEAMFRSLMIDEYGKQIAAQGGIGLSDAIKRQLLAVQEMPQ